MLVVAAARPAPPGAVTLSVADAPGRLELRPDARYVVNLQRDSGATRGGVACFVEQPLPLTHWVGGCAGAAARAAARSHATVEERRAALGDDGMVSCRPWRR